MFASGLDLKKINECIGDPDADKENPVLKAEQDAQVYIILVTIRIIASAVHIAITSVATFTIVVVCNKEYILYSDWKGLSWRCYYTPYSRD